MFQNDAVIKLMQYSGYCSPSGLSTTSTLWLKQGIFVWQLGPAVSGGGGSALITCISNYMYNIISLKQNFLPHSTCERKKSNTFPLNESLGCLWNNIVEESKGRGGFRAYLIFLYNSFVLLFAIFHYCN